MAQANDELRRAKAEAETANQAKDEFLGVLSHELRTPLASVLLTSSLLEKRSDLPPDVLTDMQVISRNVELEARIIDDLLDLTRVARGKMHFDFRRTDLHPLICAAVDFCARGPGAKIQLELGARRHFVDGDPARLQQVFWNLLNNARKFTPADGCITVRTSNNGDGRIRVTVSDTGVGIELEFLPRIFTAFEQGRVDRARQFGGLGLGLAICKIIVDAHGGTIRAASAGMGQGATITLELRTHVPSAGGKHSTEPKGGQRPQAQSLRILLVDDNASLLKSMARLVASLGHHVQTATGVKAALELAEREQFDVLISDLGLPDGSGHELMRQLKSRQDLRGIALSGYGMEEDVRQSREAGFS